MVFAAVWTPVLYTGSSRCLGLGIIYKDMLARFEKHSLEEHDQRNKNM